MTKSKMWFLVSSSVHALILRDSEEDASQAPIELASKARSTHLGEIMSDQAGRSFSSGSGGRRAAMEPGSDPVKHDMQVFAREILDLLEKHHRAGDFEKLAIVAAPAMLGVLRDEITSSLRTAVVVEHSANLVHLPAAELRKAVREILREESAR